MKLLFMSGSDRFAAWHTVLADLAPEIELVDANAPHDPDDIEFALVWQYPPGALKRYRNLRIVSSLGAGIDHLLRGPDFPVGVPFVR
ncbi:MAG: glyoxylate/hydroxypyruvate reductase A, partial [Rhodospirillales bacterium]